MSAITKSDPGAALERLIIEGDLSRLTSEQRVEYYRALCESLGLNPVTRPFDYLNLNGKLVLYANKGCAEQLRISRHISLREVEAVEVRGCYRVKVEAQQGDRVDFGTGAVPIGHMKDGSDQLANAIMKTETKAKRRATLSICGLGAIMDETELDTVSGAVPIKAELVETDGLAGFQKPPEKPIAPQPPPTPPPAPAPVSAPPAAKESQPAREPGLDQEEPYEISGTVKSVSERAGVQQKHTKTCGGKDICKLEAHYNAWILYTITLADPMLDLSTFDSTIAHGARLLMESKKIGRFLVEEKPAKSGVGIYRNIIEMKGVFKEEKP